MRHKHHNNCSAPICQDDDNAEYKRNVLWYAGEEVCQKKPFLEYQRKQKEINREVKKGKFKNLLKAYTADYLESGLI